MGNDWGFLYLLGILYLFKVSYTSFKLIYTSFKVYYIYLEVTYTSFEVSYLFLGINHLFKGIPYLFLSIVYLFWLSWYHFLSNIPSKSTKKAKLTKFFKVYSPSKIYILAKSWLGGTYNFSF